MIGEIFKFIPDFVKFRNFVVNLKFVKGRAGSYASESVKLRDKFTSSIRIHLNTHTTLKHAQ